MSDTRTYMMGGDAFIVSPWNGEGSLVDAWDIQRVLGFVRDRYLSSWRVLHIDGFEPMYRPLPRSYKHQLQFFASLSSGTPYAAATSRIWSDGLHGRCNLWDTREGK